MLHVGDHDLTRFFNLNEMIKKLKSKDVETTNLTGLSRSTQYRAMSCHATRRDTTQHNATPMMLNAQCSMLNAQCSTLNTQHSTLNTQHSTLNTQHSTLNAPENNSNCWAPFKLN
jgi:hypothetical protein